MAFTNELNKAIAEKATAFAQDIATHATQGALSAVKTALQGAPAAKPQKKKVQAKKPAPVAATGLAVTDKPLQAIDHSPKTAQEEKKDAGLNGSVAPKKRGRAKTQPSVCTMTGCLKPTLAKGLCSAHYRAARYALAHPAKDAAAPAA